MNTIRIGSTGADVRTWQRVIGVTVDGIFGIATETATKRWQWAHQLTADGIVGPKTWAAAGVRDPIVTPAGMGYPFQQARYFSPASRSSVTLVVIHTMEAPEGPKTAENVASWFASETSSKASAHYNVDANSIVQSVLEKDIAWHAGPVNDASVGVEHAGYAKQTAAEWADPYSRALLERSAQLVGDICRRHRIPVVRLKPEDLAAGMRLGICGHIDVTRGLTGGRGHVDPGEHFPWDWYLDRVRFHSRPFVELEVDGETWLVAPTYIAPVAISEAKRVAEARGCQLPTPRLVDAIWKAADLRVEPTTMTPNRGDDVAQFASHAALVEGAVGSSAFTLLAGTHKDVVDHDGVLALYGWHRGDGSVIQGPFAGHDGPYRDYSQGLRLVRRA